MLFYFVDFISFDFDIQILLKILMTNDKLIFNSTVHALLILYILKLQKFPENILYVQKKGKEKNNCVKN